MKRKENRRLLDADYSRRRFRTSSKATTTNCFTALSCLQASLDFLFFLKKNILARHHLEIRKVAYLTRDKKMVMMTTLFNVGTFFRGGVETRGKPICAMQAKMFCSLKKSQRH
jgi:hypothetical protein